MKTPRCGAQRVLLIPDAPRHLELENAKIYALTENDNHDPIAVLLDDWSIFSVRQRIDHFNTPVQTWGSWFDSGVANGVLHRFMTQSYPQRAFIGAWTHGGFRNASPYVPRNAPADPVFAIQMNDDLCFIDRFTNPRGARPLKPRKLLTYYTVGEEHWKTTTVWPVPQAKPESWYFDARNSLSPQKPDGSWGADEYTVDFTATTGRTNRWHTNGGVEEVWYGDRKAEESHSSCNDDVTIAVPTAPTLEVLTAPPAPSKFL